MIKIIEFECFDCKENKKYLIFVKHIEQHLKDARIKGKVLCKICGKDIDQIFKEDNKYWDDYNEELKKKKRK